MEEQNKNAKRRDRIKTILIIFLVIMLVLTFFSNTIQNYSLPTVSAQYASYGNINEKIRGSGIVTANQSYEVKAEGSRTVTSVSVKSGDEIHTGDTLFVLDAADNGEAVRAAQAAIDEAELAYQKALLTAAPDYAAQDQEIANAREDLQKAINELNAARRSGSGISEAAYQQAKNTAADAAARITDLTAALTALSGEGDLGVYAGYIADAKQALDNAAAAVAAAQADAEAKAAAVTVTSAEQEQTIRTLERTAEAAETAYNRAKEDADAAPENTELRRAMEDAKQTWDYALEDVTNAQNALTSIRAAEAALSDARDALTAAQNAQAQAQSDYDGATDYVRRLIEADIAAANAQADAAAQTIAAYEGQTPVDIAALEAAVTAQERTLQNLLIALAETKRTDELTQEIADLDLQSQREAIDRQKEALTKLQQNSGTLTVTSKHDGIVSAVNFHAGDTVADGDLLAEITLTDAGYTVEFSVTAEQARKVHTGMTADIVNGWYYDMQVMLTGIKADTSAPGSTGKILTFSVTGSEVTVGQLLALSISCSSQSYDCVVPTSAIMEDSNGKFVLVVNAKSTPLGNRYYANRADITVLASDEINSAVSGDVNSSDYIVTASEKPLTPGMQVRMEGKK